MSRLAILATLLFVWGARAQIVVDFNCTGVNPTDGTLAYVKSAVNCNNKMSDAGCKNLFGPAADSKVIEMKADPRPENCYVATAGDKVIDESVKDAAIEYCPKFCGYCCQTPAYSCSNKNPPNINCDSVTDAMCDDPAWRQIIADNCPNKCGFCLMGGCVDKAVDCDNDPSICNNMNLQAFVNENCQRTCQRCNSTSTATTTASSGGGGGTCSDSSTNCANWKTNGFCTSTFYTLDQKKQYCGNTCGLC